MKHLNYIKSNFKILAEDSTTNSILFCAYGETVCEINGTPFSCNSIEEFWELVEFFGEEDFAE